MAQVVYSVVSEGGSPVQVPGFPITSGGVPGGVSPRIVWRPSGTGDAQTWAEVMALLGVIPNVEIFVDEPESAYSIPAGAYDLFGSYFRSPLNVPVSINMVDGAVLTDLTGLFGSVQLTTNATTTTAPLQFTSLVPTLQLEGNECILIANGTHPAIKVGSGSTLFLSLSQLSGVNGATPAIALDPTGVCFLRVEAAGFIAADMITGDGTTFVDVLQDGSYAYTTFAGFTGTYSNQAIGMNGGEGPGSTFRPGSPLPGCVFFDTELDRLEVWDGSVWSSVCSSKSFFTDNNTAFGTAGAPATLTSIVGLAVLPGDSLDIKARATFAVTVATGDITLKLRATPTTPPGAPVFLDMAVDNLGVGTHTMNLCGRIAQNGEFGPAVYTFDLLGYTDGVASAALTPQGATIGSATLGITLTPKSA